MMPFTPDDQQASDQTVNIPTQPNWLTGNRTSNSGKFWEGLVNTLSIPSYAAGGIVKSSKDILSNIGKTNPIQEAFIKGKTGKPLDTINTLGVTEGIKNKTPLMNELPAAIGVNPDSAAGVTVGLAGELALPDVADIAIASKLANRVGTKTGKILEKGSEWLAQAGIKPSPSQIKKFEEVSKKPIGQFLVEEGLTGSNVAGNLSNKIDNVQESFDDIAVRSSKKINMNTVFAAFRKEYDDLASSIFPQMKRKGEDIREVFNNLVFKYFPDLQEEIASGKMIGNNLTLDVGTLTKERKNADALIKQGSFNLPLEQAVYLRTVRNALQNAIQEGTKDLGDLKSIGLQLRSLYRLQDIVDAQKYVTSAGRLGGLGDLFSIGAGAAAGTAFGNPALGAVLAPVLRRTATSPEVIGGSAKVVNKLGTGLSKPGIIRTLARESARLSKEAAINLGREKKEDATPGFIPDEPTAAPTYSK